MNEALADWEALHSYAKPADVESAMNILEEAGFNAENWVCLTTDYQVWWSKSLNRCVLYNSTTAEVEYPSEYKTTDLLSAANGWYIYNANHIKAQQFTLSLGSAEGATGATSFADATKVADSSSTATVTNAKNNIVKMDAIISSTSATKNTTIISAITGSTTGTVHVFATKEKVSSVSESVVANSDGTKGTAYASLQVASVSGTDSAVTIQDANGTTNLAENFYYLTIVEKDNPDATAIGKAEQAAGEMLYNIFDQITTGKIPSDVTIVVDTSKGDVTLDVSACEWAPCKYFTGYFGTSDSSHKVIIDGVRLTSATGYAQTVQFTGSATTVDGVKGYSKYFVTGFFGTVYGDTTIENVTFKNLTISSPATDFTLGAGNQTRNTVGIIGGIIDQPLDDPTKNAAKSTITLSNITVESSCSITGDGSVGGLVGYIGAAGDTLHNQGAGTRTLSSNITIDNCQVLCNVSSTATVVNTRYNPVGGIIGFITRINSGVDNNEKPLFSLEIKGCKYSGTLTGATGHGAVCGDLLGLSGEMIIDGGDYSAAKFVTSATTTSCCASLCEDSAGHGPNHMSFVTVKNLTSEKLNSDYAPFAYGYNGGTVLSYQIDKTTTWTK